MFRLNKMKENIIKWRDFWDFFKVTVDQNMWFSEIDRFFI